METTCCPAYGLRLKADNFTPSKEQQRVLRRMQRYLDGTWGGKEQELSDKCHKSEELQGFDDGDEIPSPSNMKSPGSKDYRSKEEELLDRLSKQIDIAIQSLVETGDLPRGMQYPEGIVKNVSPTKRRRIAEGSKDLLYTSSISFQISAMLRKAKSDCNISSTYLFPKAIAEKVASVLQHPVNSHAFSVKPCNGHINYYSSVKETSENPQDESEVGEMIPENPQRNKRKLEIHLTRSRFDPEEYALYRKYQIKVHNNDPDQVKESLYQLCLVDTPLIYVPPNSDDTVPPCGFGSFHQQYRIDGRLVAVGMIDILPKYLSSNYFFWDPDLAFLTLGKYSALQEINWVRENQRHCRSLQYYCLGNYSHSCPKMRYKTTYHPSELLCPLRYKWVPYEFAKPMLDQAEYVVLSNYTRNTQLSLTLEQNSISDGDDSDEFDPDFVSYYSELFPENSDLLKHADVGNVLLGLKKTRVRYKKLRRRHAPAADKVKLKTQLLRYKVVVGRQLSERMVYSLI